MSERLKSTTGQAIWCLGMYASASTWLFNVARQVLQAAQRDKVQVLFVSNDKDLQLGKMDDTVIIKSHDIDGESQILNVAKNSRKILITIRDPRDAVASLVQAHGFEFDRALSFVERSANLCIGFTKDRRAKLFRYETCFFKDFGTIGDVAEHLGCPLEKDRADSIFESLSRAQVEKHIRDMPNMRGILRDYVSGDLLDAETQWHSHHAGRDGKTGKWKQLLNAKQVSLIERRLSFYFAALPVP